MTVYLGLYLFITVSMILTKRIKGTVDNANSKLVYIIFGAIIFVVGLRHSSMGHDLPGYIDNFYRSKQYSLHEMYELRSEIYEVGYIVLLKCMAFFLSNENWYLLFSAFISIFPVAYVVKKKEIDPYLAALIYMGMPSFAMLFSAMRQNTALAICVISILFIEKKQPIKFLLCILFASTMHSTALIFLICYPMYWINLSQKLRFYSLSIIGIIFLFRERLFTMFAWIIDDSAEIVSSDSYGIFLLLCVIYIFAIFFMDYADVEQNGYANILFIGCVMQTFASVNNLAMRIAEYFMIIIVIFIPKMIYSIMNNRSNKVILYTIFVALFIFMGLMYLRLGENNWSESYPYYWCWEEIY